MKPSNSLDTGEGLNWSQQQVLDRIAPRDRALARAAYRTAAARFREETAQETTINGRHRLITSIRQAIGQCPFRESIDDMRALCVQLEAEILAAQRNQRTTTPSAQ